MRLASGGNGVAGEGTPGSGVSTRSYSTTVAWVGVYGAALSTLGRPAKERSPDLTGRLRHVTRASHRRVVIMKQHVAVANHTRACRGFYPHRFVCLCQSPTPLLFDLCEVVSAFRSVESGGSPSPPTDPSPLLCV
ncbi:unnamed protein product [Scytosiphon promiscuus]